MHIKEVTEQTGLSIDTIRYYERIGIIMPIDRESNGIRNFKERNVSQLQFAKRMRSAGLSIESLKDYIDLLMQNNDRTLPARKKLLQNEADKLAQKIADMQDTLQYLQHKIDTYDSHMRQSEQVFTTD